MATSRRQSRELVDPEFVGSLMSALAQLRQAENELERQNGELVALTNELEAERKRYQRLFDRAPLAHLTTDKVGRISEANAAAGEMFLVEPRFLMGKPIAALVAPDDRRQFRRWLLAMRGDDRRVFRLQRRAQVTFDAEVRIFGEGSGLGWIIRDITEEVRAEKQMWDLNRDLERQVAEHAGEIAAVYNQLPIGVVAVRADRPQQRRLNPRAAEILGDARPFEAEIAAALRGEELRSKTVRWSPGERPELVLDVSATPLRGPGGDVLGALITFDDITEGERIERADREFVANASHQLRTPITAIASIVAALKVGAARDAAARGRFLDQLESEAERLARIIEAMLVLSRVQRQEAEAPLTLVRVRPLLERLVAEAKAADGVTLSYDCHESIAAIAHPALLEEAIASGLANAVEHTTAGTVAVNAEQRDGHVAIEIADTGTGMAPEVRDRAFERFFGSTSTKRSAGLGLAIAAAAIRASRGTIELASTPGAGTQLRIILPSAPLVQS